MKKFNRLMFLSLVIVALVIPSGFAQVSRTTGALQGIVTDNQGNALPGVTVTVTSPQLQGSRVAVTDSKGEYILPTLPPGTYHAEYSLTGITTVIRDGIGVNLNQSTKVDVGMKLAVTETVTVTANQVVVDPTQTVQQQNFKQDHLKYAVVGSGNRSYQNVLQQAAGVAGGSNPQVVGANNAQNNYMLDGINTTDPVTHTFGNNLAFDAIQEISIQTLGKDAEYSSSGGTVNVITKSGGNNFSGSAEDRIQNKSTQSQGKKTHPTGIAYYGATPTGSALDFDKNLQPVKRSNPEATLGGPVMRDRLWFFAAVHHPDTETTPPSTQGFTPGTQVFKGWNNFGKLTFTPVANQTLTGTFVDSYATIPHAEGSSFYRPEAGATQTQGGRTYGLLYDGIPTSKWLLNAQLGHTPARLAVFPMTPGGVVGVINNDTSIRSVAYTNFQARTSKRDEAVLNSTYYLEAAGTHAIKGGIDLNKTSFSSVNSNSGDPTTLGSAYDPALCSTATGFPAGTTCASYIVLQGGANFMVLAPKNSAATVGSKQTAIFLQDEWNPISRLTIRGGVRYETVDWTNGTGGEVPRQFKMAQPRLGVAYDVFNNASTVIHGYAGRIMDDNQLTLPSYGVAQPAGSLTLQLDPTTGKYVNLGGAIFPSGGLYDSNLKPSYSNQASLGFTQKVWRNTSVDVTYDTRIQKNLFEDYCGYYDAAGVRHDLDNCLITNQPGSDIGQHDVLRSDYHAIIGKIESRPFNALDLIASWTHGKSRGSTESTQNQNTNFDYYPMFFHNYYGYLSDDAKDRIKVDGFYRFPLDFTLGVNYYRDSGTPWTPIQTGSTASATGYVFPPGYTSVGSVFLEPRGSERFPAFQQLDAQLQKDFRIGQVKLGVIGSVFNLLNSETPTGIQNNAGTRAIVDPTTGRVFIGTGTTSTGAQYQTAGVNRVSASYGQFTAWQRPRRYEFGVKLEF